ncbi:MAG: hypothetical protein R3Y06_09245 [Faecalibacterium sp.]
MVRGMSKFKEYFADYTGQYVFIGGTACDIILGALGEDFRATKDFDIVLLMEAVSSEFVETFIRFIREGGYTHLNKGTGENQFYRFEKPTNSAFPHMIELFSRKPDFLKTLDTTLAPIHVSDEVISLSAILLDDAYYNVLQTGVVTAEQVSVLDLEYIVLFKIKAWLDLSARKAAGEVIDSKISENTKTMCSAYLPISKTITPSPSPMPSNKTCASSSQKWRANPPI